MFKVSHFILIFVYIALSACASTNPNYQNYARTELSNLKSNDLSLGSSFCISIDKIGKNALRLEESAVVANYMNSALQQHLNSKGINISNSINPMSCPNLIEKIIEDQKSLTEKKLPPQQKDFVVGIQNQETIAAYEKLLEELYKVSPKYLKNKTNKEVSSYEPLDLQLNQSELELLANAFGTETALISNSYQFSLSTGKLIGMSLVVSAITMGVGYAIGYSNDPKPIDLFLVDLKNGKLIWKESIFALVKSRKDTRYIQKSIERTFKDVL